MKLMIDSKKTNERISEPEKQFTPMKGEINPENAFIEVNKAVNSAITRFLNTKNTSIK